MAMRKATIQQQVAQSIYAQNPTDRPHVMVMGMSGPSPFIMAMITTLWLLFVESYFIILTDQALLVQRASKWTGRPQEIVHAIPRDQAPYLIGDVRPGALWSHFRFQLPGKPKPSRINVHRIWRQEMQQLVQMLHGSVPQGGMVPPQAAPQPPFAPQAQPYPPQGQPFPQQAQPFPQQGQPYPPQPQPHYPPQNPYQQ